MRKRLLLPLIGLALLAASPKVSALSELCTAIKNTPPVSSHYTLRVLQRSDRGMAKAANAEVAQDFVTGSYRASWARFVKDVWLRLINNQQLIDQSRSLEDQTACLRYDLVAIECKMEEVRDAMQGAIDRGSIVGLLQLESLLEFLSDRSTHLLRGARDPLYADPTWGNRRMFDPPDGAVWCCPQATPGNACYQTSNQNCLQQGGASFESLDACTGYGCTGPSVAEIPTEGTLCPFHSDYIEPMMSGFGCDLDVMTEARAVYTPMQKEREAFQTISNLIEEYRGEAENLLALQVELDSLFGQKSTLPYLPPEREHKQAFGCKAEFGVCTGNPDRQCREDRDCAGANFGLCQFREGYCEGNQLVRCNDSSECGDAGECKPGPPVFIPKMSLRGPFSIAKNHLRILTHFQAKRVKEGETREFEDELKRPAEFPPEKAAERERAERGLFGPLLGIFLDPLRSTIRTWSRIQGWQESQIYPQASDGQLTVAAELMPLRGAVSKMAKLAHDREGLRDFVIKFAYMLRRSCIYRPCNLRLEQILRIAYEDDCFPYTNGDFLDDSSEDPRWKKCARAACIPLPGVDNFPSKCTGINGI